MPRPAKPRPAHGLAFYMEAVGLALLMAAALIAAGWGALEAVLAMLEQT